MAGVSAISTVTWTSTSGNGSATLTAGASVNIPTGALLTFTLNQPTGVDVWSISWWSDNETLNGQLLQNKGTVPLSITLPVAGSLSRLDVQAAGVNGGRDVVNSTIQSQATAVTPGGEHNVTLVNGLNSNVASAGQPSVRVAGPSAAFSIGGLAPVSGSWLGGQSISVTNTTTQPMTIVNEDTSSTASNRITTPTGGNVLIPPGTTTTCTLIYDGTTDRWRLLTNGPELVTSIDARWFGVKADGITDDTAAWNTALTYMGSLSKGGGTLLVPAGKSIISSTLTLPVHMTLRGLGSASIISKNTPGDVLLSSHTLNGSTVADITVSDLDIENTSTQGLGSWTASTHYNSGTLLYVNGCRLLKCISSGTTGAHRPIGQLTWVAPATNSGYVGPNVTLSGTPVATYSVTIWITLGGALGAATFKYSLDNGATWSGGLTTGASVALGSTGLSAAFASGTYVINTYCTTPVFGFSLVVGTTIVDGSATWQIIDGGAGFTDVAGTDITLRNLTITGCVSGLIFNQSEIVSVDNVSLQAGTSDGFAAIYIANGNSYMPGTKYAFTVLLDISNININGFKVGICDDGGASHAFNGGQIGNVGVNWIYVAGVEGCMDLDHIFVESSGEGAAGQSEYQLPDLSALSTSVGFSPTISVRTCSADLNSGSLLHSLTPYAISTLTFQGCVQGSNNVMILGGANIFQINDLGGNVGLASNILDAEPQQGHVALCGQQNIAGGYGFYGGVGINTLPTYGVTCNSGFSLMSERLNTIVGGADNHDVALLLNAALEITSFASGSGAFSISGFVNTFATNGSTQGREGQILEIINLTGAPLTIKHQSTNSSANNRIICPTGQDVYIPATACSIIRLRYSTSQNRWMLISWPSTGPFGLTAYTLDVSAGGTFTAGTNFPTDTQFLTLVGSTGSNVVINLPNAAGSWTIAYAMTLTGANTVQVKSGTATSTAVSNTVITNLQTLTSVIMIFFSSLGGNTLFAR